MKISEAKHFLSQFEKANEQKHYLTAHSTHHYAIIDTKSAKSLNTAAIADVVEECFEALKGQGISKKHRVELLIRLKTEIRHYNKRVYKSKTLFQKIGSWFGAVSDGEKKINSIAKQAEVERKTSEAAVKQIQNIHESYTTRHEEKLRGDVQQKRKVYMRIFSGLGSDVVKDAKLEGFTQSGGIKSFIDDLIRYEESLNKSRVGLKDEIKKLIVLLQKAYETSTLHELANKGKIDMTELLLRVSEEIQELKVGDQLLIPGGYEKIRDEGHAVLYQIVKTGENKCSFTVINAGDGAKASTTWKGIGSSILNFGSQELLGVNAVRSHVYDIKYENVDLSDLDQPFLKGIFEQQFNRNAEKPMQEILERIHAKLKKPHVKKTTGREHTSQEIGNCAFKCVSSWLKGAFTSEQEYNNFKAVYTEWDVEKLKALRQSKAETANTSKYAHPKNKAKDLTEKREDLSRLNNMVKEAETVLENRRKKAGNK